jgi:hypothetical protein
MIAIEKKANERFLNRVIQLGNMWMWPDENLCYEITENKLVIDTSPKKKSLSKIVSKKWFAKNTLRK